MKLSIIIVNYNVAFFLEQCLQSVYRSLKDIEAEIFVVDNHSIDESLTMLANKFPEVKVIANKENVGFSRANNQAIKLSCGEYILLLNPDTIVEEDTFEKCIAFMDSTPKAGGLGVKMVNGEGVFLPESKRGLPIPSVAFYKIFGLSKLFPHSKRFGSYHLTYLDNEEIHAVEILSGAFMMLRKKVLDEIGYLDEDYFMYGEDIDLSYRIIKAGYQNYYFPKTRIIHYKGESTKKSSVNYVFVFYRAMQIFARKHFSHKNAKLFNWLINLAIWFRAFIALITRFFNTILLPCLDFIFIYLGLFFLAKYWEKNLLIPKNSYFPDYYFHTIIPIYILIWLLTIAFCGGYRKPIQLSKTNKGIALGTAAILLLYSLLPETFRFSRAVIVFGAMWIVIAVNLLRYLLHKLNIQNFLFGDKTNRRIAIVGDYTEAQRVANLVQLVNKNNNFIGIIETNTLENYSDTKEKGITIMGNINELNEILSIYKINELVFCSLNISSEKIIDLMTSLNNHAIDFKIAPQESISIIGSNSIKTSDDLFSIQLNAITKRQNQFIKRSFDITASLLLLLITPTNLYFWFINRHGGHYFKNIWQVLIGQKSWIGKVESSVSSEPYLKSGILHPTDLYNGTITSSTLINKANAVYSQDYSLKTDILIFAKGIRKLGR